MLEDMRKKGQTYRPQAGLSSQEADRHPTTAQAPFKRLGPAKPSQKRAGEFHWQLPKFYVLASSGVGELPAIQLRIVRLDVWWCECGPSSDVCNTQEKC